MKKNNNNKRLSRLLISTPVPSPVLCVAILKEEAPLSVIGKVKEVQITGHTILWRSRGNFYFRSSRLAGFIDERRRSPIWGREWE
ncbi:hypothetical protein CEXT_713211 [Caerostris extrusa]|uniref:Uncharacterized protein n=1 Tax=Caerostris extrusa TaxID=172846 RepID=A0AAV4TWS8_CAEEX|nr:hypothetical protein CEXT_713211 [Caerostris extrusa]